MILQYNSKKPVISPKAYILEGATIIGDVHVDDFSSVWYGSIIRGDVNKITIGKYTNIQDGCVIHVNENSETHIGNYVTVGHKAVVHGCTIGDYVLVGMGAIIIDNVSIGDNVIIGAGALITGRKSIPSNCLVYGNPARIVRELNEDEIRHIRDSALNYSKLAFEHIAAIK